MEPKSSRIEEILVVITFGLLTLVCCWALYEGWSTGEVPKRGTGDTTLNHQPFGYWWKMAGYGVTMLLFGMVVVTWTRKILRRFRD